MKILLLGSQHGNELLGEKFYNHIKTHHKDLLPIVSYRLANPRAHAKKVRYIETDLNRSYVDKPLSYEELLAFGILRYIDQQEFDLVLDLHTTTTKQSPCILVRGLDKDNKKYIGGSFMQKVILMNHAIVETSLIGKRSNAISIEVSTSDLSFQLYEQLVGDIRRYIAKESFKTQRGYYEVTGLIEKNEFTSSQLRMLKNFDKSVQGFYPVLVGEDAYKKHTHYLGFKAQRITPKQEEIRYNETNE